MFTLDDLFSAVNPAKLGHGFIPRLMDMGFEMWDIEDKVDEYLWEIKKVEEYRILKECRQRVIEFLKSIRKGKKVVGRIYPEDIEIAKNVSIESIIEVNSRGMALCPNHADTRPSMKVYPTRVHCFVCNYNDDVIGLYQKINNCSFIEAVKALI